MQQHLERLTGAAARLAHRGLVRTRGLKSQAVRGSGLEQVRHVQVVSPALRPIFPRMCGSVSTHEALLPVFGGTGVVVTLQCRAVIGALIAEHRAKRLQPRLALYEELPVIVPALVAKVPEQGAIRFVQTHPLLFAVGIVGFRDVDRDDAIRVSSEHRPATVISTAKLIGQAPFAVFLSRAHGAVQSHQGVHQPPLRRFQLEPGLATARHLQVRNDPCQ